MAEGSGAGGSRGSSHGTVGQCDVTAVVGGSVGDVVGEVDPASCPGEASGAGHDFVLAGPQISFPAVSNLPSNLYLSARVPLGSSVPQAPVPLASRQPT